MVLNDDALCLSGPISSKEGSCWPMFRPWVFSSLLCVTMLFVSAGAQQSSPDVVATNPPSFEVASIKPSRSGSGNHNWDSSTDRVAIENYSLRDLIASAYGLKSDAQVLGGPQWLGKMHFDIAAKVDDAEVAKLRSMTAPEQSKEWNLMLQSLLADRFALKVTPGERTVPVYALVVAKSGLKLTPAAANETGHSISGDNAHMTATAISMDTLADDLTTMPESDNRVVVNRTGLTIDYDFKLDWTHDRGNGNPEDAQYPGLFTALREQLGLKLKPDMGLVSVVVVEAAVEPALD
jgi:uncharacterized protein (TIGR03435 family)